MVVVGLENFLWNQVKKMPSFKMCEKKTPVAQNRIDIVLTQIKISQGIEKLHSMLTIAKLK